MLNEGQLHPVGEWYHLALTCDGRDETNFVNGVEEASGPIDFAPLTAGQTSIGVRLNRVCWFKGAIGRIRVYGRSIGTRGIYALGLQAG